MEMEMMSADISKIAEALAKAQSEITVAVYDSSNPHFKSKYASYEALRKACVLPLSRNGMAITHLLSMHEGKRMMVTQLSHVSGEWLRSFLILPQEKETPQGIGSSITYAKRYTLGSLLALSSDEDDDGEKAEKSYSESPKIVPGNFPKEPNEGPFLTEEMQEEGERLIFEKIMDSDPDYRERLLKGFGAVGFHEVPLSQCERVFANINKKIQMINNQK